MAMVHQKAFPRLPAGLRCIILGMLSALYMNARHPPHAPFPSPPNRAVAGPRSLDQCLYRVLPMYRDLVTMSIAHARPLPSRASMVCVPSRPAPLTCHCRDKPSIARMYRKVWRRSQGPPASKPQQVQRAAWHPAWAWFLQGLPLDHRSRLSLMVRSGLALVARLCAQEEQSPRWRTPQIGMHGWRVVSVNTTCNDVVERVCECGRAVGFCRALAPKRGYFFVSFLGGGKHHWLLYNPPMR